MNQFAGKIIIIIGLVVVAMGLVFYMGWGPKMFGWFGRLPGDIRIEGENSRFYFPITTSIVLSLVLTLIIRFITWFR